MSRVVDILVIGLGANGSSALYHASQRSQNLLGIDQYSPPHALGSSHGESRIIRQAYHENALYVPFVKEAYRLWKEIAILAEEELYLETGCMMLGTQFASVITGSKLSALTYNIDYQQLDSNEINDRFKVFKATASTVGVLENQAGALFPEACIRTMLKLAHENGAEIHTNETVLEIVPGSGSVQVRTSKGAYSAAKVILTAGPWLTPLVPDLNLPLLVERQVLYWFNDSSIPHTTSLEPHNMPVFIWEYEPQKMFYGFPDLGTGVKLAFHHRGQEVLPFELTQYVSPNEIIEMQQIAETYLNIKPVYTRSAVCMYTNTPDENFIIDYYPGYENLIIASPCSGHGFKFSSLTGKIVSSMALSESINYDLSPFSLKRFASALP